MCVGASLLQAETDVTEDRSFCTRVWMSYLVESCAITCYCCNCADVFFSAFTSCSLMTALKSVQ